MTSSLYHPAPGGWFGKQQVVDVLENHFGVFFDPSSCPARMIILQVIHKLAYRQDTFGWLRVRRDPSAEMFPNSGLLLVCRLRQECSRGTFGIRAHFRLELCSVATCLVGYGLPSAMHPASRPVLVSVQLAFVHFVVVRSLYQLISPDSLLSCVILLTFTCPLLAPLLCQSSCCNCSFQLPSFHFLVSFPG